MSQAQIIKTKRSNIQDEIFAIIKNVKKKEVNLQNENKEEIKMTNIEQTLTIIKPDGTRRNISQEIFKMIEEKGFTIVKTKETTWKIEDAKTFYAIHSERPFFNDLCTYMSSGAIICAILEKENAVNDYRELMGATNPANAEKDTIRGQFGISIDENTVHGSDSVENAKIEIDQIFL